MNTILFPGSFDPFTLGHASLVERGLRLFDHIVIAVGINEAKKGWIPAEERIAALRRLYAGEPRVTIASYSGLTVDFATQIGTKCILRGVRTVADYQYEMNMADINHRLSALETIVLFSEPQHAAISSSVVRELASFGRDIQEFLPEGLKYNF
ncbi:MAG: pantetheine-phosphate adenylyltransferase [Bacteroidaceae bacterium]|nr:pantetheine-phosphate adenylyltransferase [Bacteroidaceae bacterium]